MAEPGRRAGGRGEPLGLPRGDTLGHGCPKPFAELTRVWADVDWGRPGQNRRGPGIRVDRHVVHELSHRGEREGAVNRQQKPRSTTAGCRGSESSGPCLFRIAGLEKRRE
jgi:hypothetical protein